MDEERHSLIDRATRRLAGKTPCESRIDWRFAAALAGVIALGPLLTIIGAGILERSALASAAADRAVVAPRLARETRDHAAREALRKLVREPTVAVWIDRAASALPADVRITRMARGGDGDMEIDVTTADPDAMRLALRRTPGLEGFREIGQRRAGAMILVTYRRPA